MAIHAKKLLSMIKPSLSHSLCFPTVPDLSDYFLPVPSIFFPHFPCCLCIGYVALHTSPFNFRFLYPSYPSFPPPLHCYPRSVNRQLVLLLAHNLLLSILPSHTSCTCSSLSYKLLPHNHILGTNNISVAPFQMSSPYSSRNLKTPSPVAPQQIQLILTNHPVPFLLYEFSAASPHKFPPPPEKILPPHQ